jgi:hypothetical protein
MARGRSPRLRVEAMLRKTSKSCAVNQSSCERGRCFALGDGSGDSDNLDFPVRSGWEEQVAAALLDFVARESKWDFCEFNTMPADSPVASCLGSLSQPPPRTGRNVSDIFLEAGSGSTRFFRALCWKAGKTVGRARMDGLQRSVRRFP